MRAAEHDDVGARFQQGKQARFTDLFRLGAFQYAVASTPMTPLLVPSAEGLTAGSIPTKGSANCARRCAMAAAVAVLQATTITSAPRPESSFVMAVQRSRIKSADLSP